MLSSQLNSGNTIPAPSSLQSALTMDANQPHLQMQPPPQPPPQAAPAPTTGKRRRKGTENGDDAPAPPEPRRLRRSHEACARCRSKKIKCDSKHPRCTACATAGTICNQEDRHRQTLTPRGHTEHIEHQLAQCEALLKLRYPGFTLDSLDDLVSRENIDPNTIGPPPVNPVFQMDSRAGRPDQTPPHQKAYPPPMFPQPPQYPPYHPMMPGPYGPAYHPQIPMQAPPGPYNPHLHPFQHPGPPYVPPVLHPPPPPPPPPAPAPAPGPLQSATPSAQPSPPQPAVAQRPAVSKGTDPNGNDMSNTEALAKNFGVSAAIVNNIMDSAHDKEDLAVGSNGLTSGRDRSLDSATPRDPSQWVQIAVRRNSTTSATAPNISLRPVSNSPTVEVWLPKDRETANLVVDIYFRRLNPHRPVFTRKEFDKILDDLYDGTATSYDPGYVCSVYLVFALGTLSDLNQRAVKVDMDDKSEGQQLGPALAKKLMPASWPQYDEFFERALVVKPDLRVTISSLQALILLHWYLYTERQGRTLWRLVGSLVRLSIELGLHHDPTTQLSASVEQQGEDDQQNLFTEEECQLRIRLWGIVLVQDRGTSILLGRPLAIGTSDTNTPHPSRPLKTPVEDFSEHFELSHAIADIQADIINALYTPKKQAPDTIMRNATRIIDTMSEFRRSLPERYKNYFGGTEDWSTEKRVQLVEGITEDEGLTLLKLGIARILLLRALFSSKDLPYTHRRKALVDAIITSHNTIVIHNQLIRFPNIAFFTSPIPLHIAAMVILYGHMSKVGCLPFDTALGDLCLALDMLPRFRWRWERKDMNGAHPLIARLAERVMQVNLRAITPSSSPVLMCEPEWRDDPSALSPITKSQHGTPTMAAAYTSSGPVIYGPQPRPVNGGSGGGIINGSHSSGGSTPHDKPSLIDVPTDLFYPFYPEVASEPARNGSSNSNGSDQGYTHILAQAAGAAHASSYGCQPSHDSFMSEERDMAPILVQSQHQQQHAGPPAQQQQQQQQQQQPAQAQHQPPPPPPHTMSMWANVPHGPRPPHMPGYSVPPPHP